MPRKINFDISDDQICQMDNIAIDKAIRVIERAFKKAYLEGSEDVDRLLDLKRRYISHIHNQYGITSVK